MATRDSLPEVESIVESDINSDVSSDSTVDKASPIKPEGKKILVPGLSNCDVPSDSAVNKASPIKPEGKKILVPGLSTDESGYVKIIQIEDSVHVYDIIDESKLEKDVNQLGSTEIRDYRPHLPPRPTTPSVPVPFYEGSETITSTFNTTTQTGQQILIRGVPDKLSIKDIARRLEADVFDYENAFEDLRVNRTSREAIITLRSMTAVDDILGRARSGETFILGDTEVELLPYSQPPVDETKVFLSGLARDTAAEDICTYVKSILVDRPYRVVIGDSPGTALLCLENPADTLMLEMGLRTYSTGQDQMWHLSAVERTRKLRVNTTGGEISAESLKAYFEQKEISKGGATESIILRTNFEDYIVTFANYEDAETVLDSTNHMFNDTKLDVSIYPSCLDPSEEFLTRIPAPLKFHNLDPYICRFLRHSPRYREYLEYALKRHFGRLLWPPEKSKDCLQIVCDVRQDDRGAKGKIRHWAKISAAAVVETCKMIHVQYTHCAVEVFEDLKKEIQKMEVLDPEAINVFHEKNIVVIAGEEKFVKQMARKVKSRIQKMEHTLDILGENITKILKVKAHEMELIPATRCLEQLKNVKMELEKQKNRVHFNGKKELVDKALKKVKETIKGLPKQKVEGINKLEWKLLQTERTRKYFENKLREAKIPGVLVLLPDDTLVLYSVTQAELEKAATILKMSLKSSTIEVKSNIGKRGKRFLAKLELVYSDELRTELCRDTLNFVSVDTLHEEIKEKIQHYVDSRQDTNEIIHIDPGTFRYMFVYKQQDIYDIVERHKSQNVEIDIIDKPCRKGFMICGEKEKCKLAIVELNVIVGSIIRSDHIVSFDRFEKFLQTIEGKTEIKAIDFAEKCVLTLTTSLPLVPLSEKRSSFAASCKIGQAEIKVVEGDILDTEANFIVCPTLSTLELKKGLGGALVEKGGFCIQKYCNDHIERGKSLKDGDVLVGTAGSLSCKGIIYMILSNWNDRHASGEAIISNAVYNCLKEADRRKSLSIAFPPVGVGLFGYPKEMVAEILMLEIKGYLTENGTSTFLRQVFVYDLKGNVTFLLVQEIQKGFGQVTVHTTESSKEDITDSSQQEATGEIISGLKTKIVKGSMLSEDSDVIVNSMNSNLDLHVGKLTKILFDDGGEKLAAEWKYPEGLSLGQLAVTTGGNLKCKAIFHGILLPWNQDRDRAEIIQRNFMRDCLTTANKRHYTSLSFPLLGSGVLKFPPDVAADLMLDTIKEFEKDFPNSSIKTVRIVIQPGDEDLSKEFEKRTSFNSSQRKQSKIARVSQRQSCQLSNVIIDAGTTFTTTIDHVTLRIEHGDLTKSTTSVIVNSVVGDLNMNTGSVSKAILKAGGMSIQREANDNIKTFKEDGIVMTNAGKLLCQKIIHVKAKTRVADWRKVVMRCLEECEKAKLNSVSFPAFGTGGKGLPASQMARVMIDAFKKYIRGEKFKRELKSIAVVLYEENLLECFIKEAKPALESSSGKSTLRKIKDIILETDEIREEPTIVHIYSESTDTAERVLQRLKDLHEKFIRSVKKADTESVPKLENKYI